MVDPRTSFVVPRTSLAPLRSLGHQGGHQRRLRHRVLPWPPLAEGAQLAMLAGSSQEVLGGHRKS